MSKTVDRQRFTAPLQRMQGGMGYMYVEVPFDVEQVFGTKGKVRVLGTINGVPMDRALMPTRNGAHIIILGGDIRKAAKLHSEGDLVNVECWPHPNPDHVALPEEMVRTFEWMPEMHQAWQRLTPGMQRSMLHWVNSARTAGTKANRLADLMKRMEDGSLLRTRRPGGER